MKNKKENKKKGKKKKKACTKNIKERMFLVKILS